MVTVSVTAPLPMPEVGFTVSQAALSLTDQVSVPPPVLLMVRVWADGLAPPCVAAKEKFVGLAPIAGGIEAAVTVNVTGTAMLIAPVAAIITVPL